MTCSRFEELFIKEAHNELFIHIQSCETCMYEYKKMQKTQSLIKEVKHHFINQNKNISLVKMAASLTLAITVSFLILNGLYVPKLSYEDAVNSSFPVDEYGLLDIN